KVVNARRARKQREDGFAPINDADAAVHAAWLDYCNKARWNLWRCRARFRPDNATNHISVDPKNAVAGDIPHFSTPRPPFQHRSARYRNEREYSRAGGRE
ncbi:MAG TPA: hypothetical protein PKD21_08020, partial [Candidatus Competibacter phosphatis]|nr:hypothetical protein [Candidatus Competibacter phosphatis]